MLSLSSQQKAIEQEAKLRQMKESVEKATDAAGDKFKAMRDNIRAQQEKLREQVHFRRSREKKSFVDLDVLVTTWTSHGGSVPPSRRGRRIMCWCLNHSDTSASGRVVKRAA